MNLFCLVDRHRKGRVEWDGFHYRSECSRCGASIVRARHNVWKRAKKAPTQSLQDYQPPE